MRIECKIYSINRSFHDGIYKNQMKEKQIIFAVFCCFVLLTAVKTHKLDAVVSQAPKDVSHSDSKALWKADYNEKVFVQIDQTHYYKATISNKQKQIQIKILNEEVRVFELCFKRLNPVIFIDANQNVIIVKEVSPLGVTLSYFVLQIIYDTKRGKFYLDYFAVNPRVDNEFFHLPASFDLTSIIELDINREWVAVILKDNTDHEVYKINIAEKLNTLMIVGWFYTTNQKITGGNSKVLFDQNKNQFLVDTNNCRAPAQPTIYDSVSVCSLTKLPLYDCNRIVELAGWNFQYISQSSNHKSLTTFLYQGYGNLSIQGQVNLKSSKEIRYLSDDYSFFIAITDCDVYLSNVYWVESTKSYNYFGNTLSKTVSNASKRDYVFNEWSKIDAIVFIQGKFYFIASNNFYVYGSFSKAFTKIYQKECISDEKDSWVRLFVEINKYHNKAE